MESRKKDLSSNPICHCKNSIKLRILECVNTYDKPLFMENLIDDMFKILKEENSHIEIDDLFLKTYIRSIISELIESKLIKLYQIENPDSLINKKIYFVNLQSEFSSLIKNSSEESEKEKLQKETNVSEKKVNTIETEKEIKEKRNDLEYRNKLMDEIILMRKKIDKLKKENLNKKLHEEIHKYNEIKDIGQEILGYIANSKGRRVKELYDELAISDDDK